MAFKRKEPTEKVSIRIPASLRENLQLLARADKRDEEADYWRKVLSDHVDEMRRAGKLPLGQQLSLAGELEVEVQTAGGAR